jgi:hypothetical protein
MNGSLCQSERILVPEKLRESLKGLCPLYRILPEFIPEFYRPSISRLFIIHSVGDHSGPREYRIRPIYTLRARARARGSRDFRVSYLESVWDSARVSIREELRRPRLFGNS